MRQFDLETTMQELWWNVYDTFCFSNNKIPLYKLNTIKYAKQRGLSSVPVPNRLCQVDGHEDGTEEAQEEAEETGSRA